jgi:hypothetical protein
MDARPESRNPSKKAHVRPAARQEFPSSPAIAAPVCIQALIYMQRVHEDSSLRIFQLSGSCWNRQDLGIEAIASEFRHGEGCAEVSGRTSRRNACKIGEAD